MDGEGFEPSTSAMPTRQFSSLEYVRKPFERRMENKREYLLRISDSKEFLSTFKDFMRINMQLRPSTVRHTAQDIKRFLKNQGM